MWFIISVDLFWQPDIWAADIFHAGIHACDILPYFMYFYLMLSELTISSVPVACKLDTLLCW